MEFVMPPPPTGDPRRHLRFRDAAVDRLRGMPTFAKVSRRLLTDLMDVAEHHDLRAAPQGRSFKISGIALLVVLEGAVVVDRPVVPPAPPAGPPGAPPPAPSVPEQGPLDEGQSSERATPPPQSPQLQSGVYLGNDQRWESETNLRIRTAENEEAYVIAVSREEMVRWLRVSPTLLHGLGFPTGHRVLITDEELFPDSEKGASPRGR